MTAERGRAGSALSREGGNAGGDTEVAVRFNGQRKQDEKMSYEHEGGGGGEGVCGDNGSDAGAWWEQQKALSELLNVLIVEVRACWSPHRCASEDGGG